MRGARRVEDYQSLLPRHRLTVEDFHKMGEVGIFDEDARVELIEGELVDMAPIGSRHAGVVRLLIHLLSPAIGNSALLDVQNPLVLDEYTEPQPDMVLLKPRDDFYTTAHPTPEDVLLLIEVADSSAEYDRLVKIPLYARSRIREVWVVDVVQKRLERYHKPQPAYAGYQHIEHYHEGTVSPEALPDIIIPVADLFLTP